MFRLGHIRQNEGQRSILEVAIPKRARERFFCCLDMISGERAFNLFEGFLDDRPEFLLALRVTSEVVIKRDWALHGRPVRVPSCPCGGPRTS
jgi:hypothetical protein